LPANGLKPTFKDVEEGPTRKHPLVRYFSRKLVPEEKDGRVIEEIQPRPNATTKKGRSESAFCK
jgi:hypothetical protein